VGSHGSGYTVAPKAELSAAHILGCQALGIVVRGRAGRKWPEMKRNICEMPVCHRDSGRESNLLDGNAILKIDGGDFDNVTVTRFTVSRLDWSEI